MELIPVPKGIHPENYKMHQTMAMMMAAGLLLTDIEQMEKFAIGWLRELEEWKLETRVNESWLESLSRVLDAQCLIHGLYRSYVNDIGKWYRPPPETVERNEGEKRVVQILEDTAGNLYVLRSVTEQVPLVWIKTNLIDGLKDYSKLIIQIMERREEVKIIIGDHVDVWNGNEELTKTTQVYDLSAKKSLRELEKHLIRGEFQQRFARREPSVGDEWRVANIRLMGRKALNQARKLLIEDNMEGAGSVELTTPQWPAHPATSAGGAGPALVMTWQGPPCPTLKHAADGLEGDGLDGIATRRGPPCPASQHTLRVVEGDELAGVVATQQGSSCPSVGSNSDGSTGLAPLETTLHPTPEALRGAGPEGLATRLEPAYSEQGFGRPYKTPMRAEVSECHLNSNDDALSVRSRVDALQDGVYDPFAYERTGHVTILRQDTPGPMLAETTAAAFFNWEKEFIQYWKAGGAQSPMCRLTESQNKYFAFLWMQNKCEARYGSWSETLRWRADKWFAVMREMFLPLLRSRGTDDSSIEIRFKMDSDGRPNFEGHLEQALDQLQTANLTDKEKCHKLFRAYRE